MDFSSLQYWEHKAVLSYCLSKYELVETVSFCETRVGLTLLLEVPNNLFDETIPCMTMFLLFWSFDILLLILIMMDRFKSHQILGFELESSHEELKAVDAPWKLLHWIVAQKFFSSIRMSLFEHYKLLLLEITTTIDITTVLVKLPGMAEDKVPINRLNSKTNDLPLSCKLKYCCFIFLFSVFQ